MDNSSEQNGGLKPNSTTEELARALVVDLASVVEQYGLHLQSGLHPQAIAIAMVTGFESVMKTLATQQGLSQGKTL